MGWAGFNCSLPHKVAVIDHLDAPGTLGRGDRRGQHRRRHRRRLVGHNTDGQGFVESLRTVVDPAGLDLVVLGAGGAARAVAVETALAGAASVTVVNRDAAPRRGARPGRHRRHRRARDVRALGPARMPCPTGADVVVNATSVGFGDADALVDVDLDTLRAGLVVADVVVSPPRTALLRAAEERGARTLDGLGHAGRPGRPGRAALDRASSPTASVMRAAAARALGLE